MTPSVPVAMISPKAARISAMLDPTPIPRVVRPIYENV